MQVYLALVAFRETEKSRLVRFDFKYLESCTRARWKRITPLRSRGLSGSPRALDDLTEINICRRKCSTFVIATQKHAASIRRVMRWSFFGRRKLRN